MHWAKAPGALLVLRYLSAPITFIFSAAASVGWCEVLASVHQPDKPSRKVREVLNGSCRLCFGIHNEPCMIFRVNAAPSAGSRFKCQRLNASFQCSFTFLTLELNMSFMLSFILKNVLAENITSTRGKSRISDAEALWFCIREWLRYSSNDTSFKNTEEIFLFSPMNLSSVSFYYHINSSRMHHMTTLIFDFIYVPL